MHSATGAHMECTQQWRFVLVKGFLVSTISHGFPPIRNISVKWSLFQVMTRDSYPVTQAPPPLKLTSISMNYIPSLKLTWNFQLNLSSGHHGRTHVYKLVHFEILLLKALQMFTFFLRYGCTFSDPLILLPPASAVEVIESVRCVCVWVHVREGVCVCWSIMAKGLWGEGTLQHGSQEVRQRSGAFIYL